MVETAINTGLRWGELIALKPRHLDVENGRLSVEETIVEISIRNSPTGQRMLTKPYPKDNEPRTMGLPEELVTRLAAHIADRGSDTTAREPNVNERDLPQPSHQALPSDSSTTRTRARRFSSMAVRDSQGAALRRDSGQVIPAALWPMRKPLMGTPCVTHSRPKEGPRQGPPNRVEGPCPLRIDCAMLRIDWFASGNGEPLAGRAWRDCAAAENGLCRRDDTYE